jgi:hypothetical protein
MDDDGIRVARSACGKFYEIRPASAWDRFDRGQQMMMLMGLRPGDERHFSMDAEYLGMTSNTSAPDKEVLHAGT